MYLNNMLEETFPLPRTPPPIFMRWFYPILLEIEYMNDN